MCSLLSALAVAGMLCRTWDAVQPVARGFMQVASDLCTASSSIRWQQRELPLYSLDDVFLNGRINTSGYNQCVVDTPLVFCPCKRGVYTRCQIMSCLKLCFWVGVDQYNTRSVTGSVRSRFTNDDYEHYCTDLGLA